MGDVTPLVAMVTFFAIVGWIIRSILDHRRASRITEIQAELQRQLIEKMGAGDDLLAYLQSDAGHRLISSAALGRRNPLTRVLGAIQAGIILVVVAGAAAAVVAAIRVGPAIGPWLASLPPPALPPPAAPTATAVAYGALLLSALVVGILTSWQAAE